jgi:hypothetical protein
MTVICRHVVNRRDDGLPSSVLPRLSFTLPATAIWRPPMMTVVRRRVVLIGAMTYYHHQTILATLHPDTTLWLPPTMTVVRRCIVYPTQRRITVLFILYLLFFTSVHRKNNISILVTCT